jgi:hypothetical protein
MAQTNILKGFGSKPVVKRAVDRYTTRRNTKIIGGGILSILGGGLLGQALKGTLLTTGGPKAWEIAQKGILGKTGKFQSGKQFAVYVKNYLKRKEKDYTAYLKTQTPNKRSTPLDPVTTTSRMGNYIRNIVIPKPTDPTSKAIGALKPKYKLNGK